jgi:hypothetical protein
VRVQLLEIYNEQLRDLLDAQRSGRRLDIRCTERSGLNVPDAIQARAQLHATCPGTCWTVCMLAGSHGDPALHARRPCFA